MKTRPMFILGPAILLLASAVGHAAPPDWSIEPAIQGLTVGSVYSYQLAVRSDGTVGLAFHTSQPGALQYVEKLPGGSWSAPETIFSVNNNSLAYAFAFDPSTGGEATIAYTGWGVRPVYFTRRLAADNWSTETIESRASRLDEEIGMAYDAAGTPWVLYSGRRDQLTVAHKVGGTWHKEMIWAERARWKSIAAGPAQYPNVAVGFDADRDDDGRLDSILYADLDSGWSATLVSEDGAQALFPMVSIDPTDGTPTMGYERFTDPSQYRLARWNDGSTPADWIRKEIQMPTPTSIADTFLSKPLYSTDGRAVTSFSGPQYVHFAQRSPGDDGQWLSDYPIVNEPNSHFDSFLALHPSNDAPYVAFYDSGEGTVIRVAALPALPALPGCQNNDECDDGAPCTTDTCQPNGFCSNTPMTPCYPNGSCEQGETCENHPIDCSSEQGDFPVCGNGFCEPGEDCVGCPLDCAEVSETPSCGDGICQPDSNFEDCRSCPQDCAGKLKGKPSNQFCCGEDTFCDDPRCQASRYECSDAGSICCVGGLDCDDPRCSADGFVCSTEVGTGSCCGNTLCESFEATATCEIDVLADPSGTPITINWEHTGSGNLISGTTGEDQQFPDLVPGGTLVLYNEPGGFHGYPDISECRSTCSGLVQAFYHDSLSAENPGVLGPMVSSGCSQASEYGYYTKCCIVP